MCLLDVVPGESSFAYIIITKVSSVMPLTMLKNNFLKNESRVRGRFGTVGSVLVL